MIQLTSTHPLPPPATTPPPPAHPAPAPTATGLAKALDALKAAFPPEPPPMLDLTGLIRSLEKAKLFPPKSQLIPDVTVGQPEPPDRRQAMIHLEVIYQKINVAMKPFYEKYRRFAMAFTAKTLETNCNRMAADLTLELADDEEIVNARNKFDSEVEYQGHLAGAESDWLRGQLQPWLRKAQALIPTLETSDRMWTWTLAGGRKINAIYMGRNLRAITVMPAGRTTSVEIPLTKLSTADLVWLGLKPPPTKGPQSLLGPPDQL
jgi:hypothetical protein